MNKNEYELSGLRIDSRDFHIVESIGKSVKIRGIAVPANITSRNNRHYTAVALAAGAHTFNGRPLTINHSMKEIVGNIDTMTYSEEQEALLYEAWIKKEPYVSLARSKNPKLRGVSIEADYLFSKCRDCGQKFYTNESYKGHMYAAHMKSVCVDEPHGLKGQALSLVVEPEEPGVPQNTMEVAEMVRRDDLHVLVETIIREQQEKEKMTSNTKNVVSGPPYQIKEEAPKTPVKEETEKPAPPAKPEEEAEDEEEEEKKKKKPPATEKKTIEKIILKEEDAFSIDACIAKGGSPEECAAQYKERCAAKEFKQTVAAKINEITEAFNGLTFPEDDKSWEQKIAAVQETVNKQVSELAQSIPKEEWKQPLQEAVSAIKPYDDKELREMIAALPKDDLGWKQIQPYNDQPLREAIAAIKPYDDKPIKEAVAAIKPYDDSALKTALEALTVSTQKSLGEMTQKTQLMETALTEVKAENKTLKETIEKQAVESLKTKETFEKLLEKADANNIEIKHTLEERLKEANKKLEETAKKLSETAEKADKAQTLAENVDDKQKASFKGVSKKTVKEASVTTSFNPYA